MMTTARTCFALVTCLIACGTPDDTPDDTRPVVTSVTPEGCGAQSSLTYARTLAPSGEVAWQQTLQLSGFDVDGETIHLLYKNVSSSTTCGWLLRSLDLATGKRTSELALAEDCKAPRILGGLAATQGKIFARGDGKLVRLDPNDAVNVGSTVPNEAGLDGDNGKLFSMTVDGTVLQYDPAATPASPPRAIGFIKLPNWGSVGPAIDGARIWLHRDAFEKGQTNKLMLTGLTDGAPTCTYDTENLPGLRGQQVRWFAAQAGHVYVVTARPTVGDSQPLAIVDLELKQ
jgi:hypothetical protein